jgi:hypothetical protein
VEYELQGMCKEAVLTYFVLRQQLPAQAAENNENFQSIDPCFQGCLRSGLLRYCCITVLRMTAVPCYFV